MQWKNSGPSNVLARFCLATFLLVGLTDTGIAEPKKNAANTTLTGTWAIQVTLRDCQTSAPLGPPFNALVTFHRGGTITETAGSLAFAIGQRNAGHGSWTRKSAHTYDQKMVAFILFDTQPNLPGTPGFDPTRPVSPGFFAGWQTVNHTVQLVDSEHLTSSGTNAFYKTGGEVYRTGCSTATGQRFN